MRTKRTREEVARILENFIARKDGAWDWDDFIFLQIEDPELDQIRLRCHRLDHDFPPDAPGQFCNAQGIEVIRNFMAELRK